MRGILGPRHQFEEGLSMCLILPLTCIILPLKLRGILKITCISANYALTKVEDTAGSKKHWPATYRNRRTTSRNHPNSCAKPAVRCKILHVTAYFGILTRRANVYNIHVTPYLSKPESILTSEILLAFLIPTRM